MKFEICPLIVKLPVPLIRRVRPVPAASERKTLPPSVVVALLFTVSVRVAAAEAVTAPLIVRLFAPAMVNVPARFTALAIVLAPPPA